MIKLQHVFNVNFIVNRSAMETDQSCYGLVLPYVEKQKKLGFACFSEIELKKQMIEIYWKLLINALHEYSILLIFYFYFRF